MLLHHITVLSSLMLACGALVAFIAWIDGYWTPEATAERARARWVRETNKRIAEFERARMRAEWAMQCAHENARGN
jgi:hypothetical protein